MTTKESTSSKGAQAATSAGSPPTAETLKITEADVRRIEAPSLYASGLRAQVVGNDFMVILTRQVPGLVKDRKDLQVAISDPVGILHMSPGTAKDLHIALGDVIGKYEKSFGKIETVYSRKQDAKARGAAPKTGQ